MGFPSDSLLLMHGSSRSQPSKTLGLMEATPAPNPVALNSSVCLGEALTEAPSPRVREVPSDHQHQRCEPRVTHFPTILQIYQTAVRMLPRPATHPGDPPLPRERGKGQDHVPVITYSHLDASPLLFLCLFHCLISRQLIPRLSPELCLSPKTVFPLCPSPKR